MRRFKRLVFSMKKLLFLLFLLLSGAVSTELCAQISETVKSIVSTIAPQDESPVPDITESDPDSIRLKEIERQLQQSKLNEMNLKLELEQFRIQANSSDSIKLARLKLRVDSLRHITPGVPVVVGEDTLFLIYAKRGGLTPHERASNFSHNIEQLGKRYNLAPDSVYLEPTEYVTDVMYGNKVIASFTDLDGLWQNTSREELASRYKTVIVDKLQQLKAENSILQLARRALYFVLVIALQYLLFRLTTYFYRKLKKRIVRLKDTRLKPFSIHEYELLDTGRQVKILIFIANICRYLFVLLQLLVTVPILFAIFPQTESLAMTIFSYLWNPVKLILKKVLDYIPNLFTIFVIWFAMRYVIRGIKYLAGEIESGKLKISGFYPDWARSTYQIVRFLLYAFMIAMIYPYLPGSNSGVFQGISVFVGLIVSLGSSTVIGNIIAGLVITYMRPFKIGDRIKLNDTTGNVIEKTPFVTRLKTPKNELVTIPNSFIMSSHTTNYSSSARNFGLIIHSEVSIGYDAPWRKVHQLLIDAALATPGVQAEPAPFVLETSLSDWYPVYQINAYIQDADQLARIYSDLHQNIQDKFNAAGVEIMSPHYYAQRDGNETTIPKNEGR